MNTEKIICFTQKNVKNFSVEDLMEIQQQLKSVPDEAFPILMNFKPRRGKFGTGMAKVLRFLLILILIFGFFMAGTLPITNIPFVEEEMPWMKTVGVVVAVALVPAICFSCKWLKNMKPFQKQAYIEFKELIMKYSNK